VKGASDTRRTSNRGKVKFNVIMMVNFQTVFLNILEYLVYCIQH